MPIDAQMDEEGLEARGHARVVTPYQRLVRDRIPEIIESMGNIAVWRELDDEAFERALLDTITRASQQFSDFTSLESLSDLLESVDAWLDLKGLSMGDVAKAREEKRKRCGTYERRLFLERVAAGDGLGGSMLHSGQC